MNYVIVGAGAIGGVIGAYLVKGGHHVTFVDKDKAHVLKMRKEGLCIKGQSDSFTVPVKVFINEEFKTQSEPIDKVLLCVKAHHTVDAVNSFKHRLHDDSYVVSFQNGLCELEIANLIGKERTIGCFVNLFADYLEPGIINYGGIGSVYIGELDGTNTARVRELAHDLSVWGNTRVIYNIFGYLWSKLAYGAILTATALTNETIADLIESDYHRNMLLDLASEVLQIAHHKGIKPEGFDDWEPSIVYPRGMRDEEKINQSLYVLVKRLRSYTKTRTGIWRDLAVRKRKTEVPQHLNPVIEMGEQAGFNMILLKALLSMIIEIENGERELSLQNLAQLHSLHQQKLDV
ncbi:hypothetical protein CU633_12530 [Bacillus sp. V3-13]|uniref:ketopantoate reductase family protein n=1 Tax=Bacillus sp. V3-13 TaxID=2053728 RepID=UPI000C793B55|nr:2-dehydropantoate 2-reductase [Bacillus sp. V3-13]PLR77038.1 hypothetical protein CU633_12530 [Bacillus sp. V3-13]